VREGEKGCHQQALGLPRKTSSSFKEIELGKTPREGRKTPFEQDTRGKKEVGSSNALHSGAEEMLSDGTEKIHPKEKRFARVRLNVKKR